ncbi:AsmA family protein [Escherichia coli]
MKFIGKLLLYILIALLVAIAGLYFLLQTRWGAEHISAWVSENSDYHLAFGAMDHRFSAPSHIVLENVTFGRDGQPATLVAKSVDIALSSRQLTEPRHVDTILLENGTLNLTDQTAPLPFKADRLQLRDMAFNSPNSEWKLSAQRVNGGVVPWSPKAGKVLGTKAQIQFSAGSLSLNDVPATNVLIEGSIDNDRVTLTNLGADIARGTLTGNAQRNADGSWQSGKPAHGGYPSTKRSLTDFFAPLRSVPSLQIGRLEVIDARLQGSGWVVTDLDLSLRNMTFSKDDWQTQEGKLSMNASEFIYWLTD